MNDSEMKYFGDTLQGLTEAAPILADKYNLIARRYSKFVEISEEEMTELLEAHVDPQEFNHLIDSDFSQGVLIGKLLTLNDVGLYLEQAEEEDA